MNRKKALYRYEAENVRWVFIAALAACLLVLLWLNVWIRVKLAIGEYLGGEGNPGVTFMDLAARNIKTVTPIALIFIAFMMIVQYADYHKRNQREFIVSLPYTQKERFLAKFAVGTGMLTAVCALFGVGVFCMRELYYSSFLKRWLVYPEYPVICGNDTRMHLLRLIILLWLVLLTGYAVFTVIHSIVSSGVPAAFISIGVVAAPLYLAYMVRFYLSEIDPIESEDIWSGINQVCGSFIGRGNFKSDFYFSVGQTEGVTCVDYGHIVPVFLALGVVFAGCSILAYLINVRQDGAKFGEIIPIPAARRIISAGMAICFSLPVAVIAAMLLTFNDYMESTASLLLSAILQAIIAAVLYLLNMKLFRRAAR